MHILLYYLPLGRLFLDISAEEMSAVSGIASIMPMLEEMPLMVSSITNEVENR